MNRNIPFVPNNTTPTISFGYKRIFISISLVIPRTHSSSCFVDCPCLLIVAPTSKRMTITSFIHSKWARFVSSVFEPENKDFWVPQRKASFASLIDTRWSIQASSVAVHHLYHEMIVLLNWPWPKPRMKFLGEKISFLAPKLGTVLFVAFKIFLASSQISGDSCVCRNRSKSVRNWNLVSRIQAGVVDRPSVLFSGVHCDH